MNMSGELVLDLKAITDFNNKKMTSSQINN